MNEEIVSQKEKKDIILPISILVAAGIFAFGMVYSAKIKSEKVFADREAEAPAAAANQVSALEAEVLPGGVNFVAEWGDLGKRMVAAGVIDADKLQALYAQRGGMTPEMKKMLLESGNGKLVMNQANAGYILNLLWALGLSQKTSILTTGPIMNTPSIKPSQFASTGGWTLAKGDTMDHFAAHNLLNLTSEQEALVAKVAKNIYRPCCGNSTYFPDCNHGMGMLGLLELMASQGLSEEMMYKGALYANSYWFPDNYLTIASYFEKQGTSWDQVDPKIALSAEYSSSAGFQKVASQTSAPASSGQGRPSSGCGT